MPCLWLKDCHVAALLAMTQNWNVFIWITNVLHFLRLFFARYRPAPFFKRSFRKSFHFQTFRSGNCSVFPQNPPDLSLRGGRIFAPDAAIFDGTKRHLGTKYEKNGTKQNRKISRDQTNRGSITFSVVSMTGIFSLCAPCSHYGHHFSFCSPCFVPGCHAFGFKIATAALRPRNDTETAGFS